MLLANYRRAVFFRCFRRGRGSSRFRVLWWLLGLTGWFICWAASSVLFLPIMDALITVLVDIGRHSLVLTGSYAAIVAATTVVCAVVYVLVVVRLTCVGSDIGLLNVNYLVSGDHVRLQLRRVACVCLRGQLLTAVVVSRT